MTEPTPLISLVMPCYNHAHFLAEAVGSVLAQDFASWELIIVNDGSTDETSQVAAALTAQSPDRIFLVEQENFGAAAARNVGIAKARGEWIVAFDSDDILAQGYLRAVAENAKAHPEMNAITGAYKEFGANDGQWMLSNYRPERFAQRCNILCCTAYKRYLWEAVGGYDPCHPYGYNDWNFWLRCTLVGFNLLCVPAPMLLYRRHTTGSITAYLREDEDEAMAFHVTMLPQIYERETIISAHPILMRMREESVRRVHKKAEKFPHLPLPWFWLGLWAEGNNEWSAAREYYQKALVLPWGHPWQVQERLAALPV